MASERASFSRTLDNRTVIAFSGDAAEQLDFLQSLVTNDISKAGEDALVYSALLTPQGKYLCDFLVWRTAEGDFRLDVATSLAADLVKRLTMYRLRRPVKITAEPAPVTVLWGDAADAGLRDPRHPALGWRVYGQAEGEAGTDDYDLHRLHLGIPESGVDLVPNDTYVLEAGFETMNGVDFRKGCYVGQEIVARMKHKTDLKKGIRLVRVEGEGPPSTPLLTADGKPAGTLLSNRDGIGLAHLRFDRASGRLVDVEESINVYPYGEKDSILE